MNRGAPAWGDPHGAACAITAKRRYRGDTTPGTFDRQRAYARNMLRIIAESVEIVDEPSPATPDPAIVRTIALVGLMGAGKSAIGKRLAQRLGLPFVDADIEIEAAAGCTIEEFFERFGEAEFRAGERRVIQRLLEGSPHVLATGGGAFMDTQTRALMREKATTIWLRAELAVLLDRVSRRSNRPLLKNGDPRGTLERLMALRYPVYAEADIVVDSRDAPADRTAEDVHAALMRHLGVTAGDAT